MRLLVVLACLFACGCDRLFNLSHVDPSEVGQKPDAPDDARTIAFAQSTSIVKNGVTPVVLQLPDPVLAGDLVVVVVGTYIGHAVTVTDGVANSYTSPFSPIDTPGGARLHAYFASSAPAPTLDIRISVDASGGSEVTAAVHVYHGASAQPLVDSSLQVGFGATPASPPVTTTEDGMLYFGITIHDLSASTSPGPGFVLRENPTDSDVNVPLATEDQVGPRKTISATFGLSYEAAWSCALLVFK